MSHGKNWQKLIPLRVGQYKKGILPVEGFTTEEIEEAFCQFDFRPAKLTTLKVMMYHHVGNVGYRYVNKRWYPRDSITLVLLKMANRLKKCPHIRKLRWNEFHLTVNGKTVCSMQA